MEPEPPFAPAARCGECGQPIGAHEGRSGAADGLVVHEMHFTDPAGLDHELTVEGAPGNRTTPALVAGVLALVVFAIAAFVAFSSDQSAGDEASGDRDATPVDQAIDDVILPDETGAGAAIGENAQGGDPNFPPGDAHIRAGEIADWFTAEVDGDQGDYSIVYAAIDGIRVLHGGGITTPEPKIAVGFEDAAGFPLFTDGVQTWGVNPDDPTDAFVVSRNYQVVRMAIDGAIAFVNDDGDPTYVGVSSFGGWGPGFDLPAGSEVLAVDGFGLLVLPPTGGTMILSGQGLAPFSDDRVVSATADNLIALRCDERLTCGLHLLGTDGGADIALPFPLGSQVASSPDRTWIAGADPEGTATILEVATGAIWELGQVDIDAMHWAPDSRFVAWSSAAEMHIAFPAERARTAVELPAVPAARALLVVQGT